MWGFNVLTSQMTELKSNEKHKIKDLDNKMNIEWKDEAVCYAAGWVWFWDDEESAFVNYNGSFQTAGKLVEYIDFQMNEILAGDFISASELNTEKKLNDAVSVFALFGFDWGANAAKVNINQAHESLCACANGLHLVVSVYHECKRQLTYCQIMAIGKLKRMMLEREFNTGENTKKFDEMDQVNAEVEQQLEDAIKGIKADLLIADDILLQNEWPKVGDNALLVSLGMKTYNKPVKITYLGDGVGCYVDLSNGMEYTFSQEVVVFKKIKTPEEELSEELAKKGVQDVVILANQIINGDFDCLKYIPKEEAVNSSVSNDDDGLHHGRYVNLLHRLCVIALIMVSTFFFMASIATSKELFGGAVWEKPFAIVLVGVIAAVACICINREFKGGD